MVKQIVSRIRKELAHFIRLPQKTRMLMASVFVFMTASPLISMFINAFIFRSQGSILPVAVYNFGAFLIIPVMFYVNGILLRKFSVQKLYYVGTCLMGIVAMTVIFSPATLALQYYFIYGILIGIGDALHWANRNLLNYQETKQENRSYFMGTIITYYTIVSLVIPFLAGWFIALSPAWGMTSTNAYVILVGFAFLLMYASGIMVLRSSFVTPKIPTLRITFVSSKWHALRLLSSAIGVVEGIAFFVPSMLILTQLGNEGILGTMQSVASLFTAGVSYVFGRKAKSAHRKPLFLASIILGLVSSLMLAFFYSPLWIILFILANYVLFNMLWLAVEPYMFDRIDMEIKSHKTTKYSYIADRELYLNMGRWVSVLSLLVIIMKYGQDVALRFAPLLTTLLVFPILIQSRRILRK